MTNAVRDQNRVPSTLGKSNSSNISLPWLVNPITGYLIVEVSDESIAAVLGTKITRDQNRVAVAGGVSSTSDSTELPFEVSPDTGSLLVDMI